MKWIAMIVSFILGQLKPNPTNPSLMFIQQALEKSRSLVFLATASFISALLFSAGVVIAAMNAFMQYDTRGSIYFSATFNGGLVLMAASTLSLTIVFSKKNWSMPQVDTIEQASQQKASPIEEAIAMLVNDFIEGRRESRQERYQSEGPPPTPSTQTPKSAHDQVHF